MNATKKKVLIYSLIGGFIAICIACFCCIKFIKFETETLTINCKDAVILSIGESYPLDIECSMKNAEIRLTTDDRDIIEIDDKNITAISSGTAIVKVNAESEGVVGSKNIKVVVEKDDIDLGVTLSKETTLYVIDKMTTEAERNGMYNFVRFSTNTDVSYVLSNPNVISFSKSAGKITAVNEGRATITFFSTVNPAIKSVHTIIVEKIKPIFSLTSQQEIVLDVDESSDFTYSISPVYYTGKAEVTAVVKDNEIAKIENNRITAFKAGETVVDVYLNGEHIEEIGIKVNEPYLPVYSFEISAESDCSISGNTIYVNGDSCLLNIKVVDERGIYYNDPIITVEGAECVKVGSKILLREIESSNLLIKVENLGLTKIYVLSKQT